ncbi:MAG TPA: methylated DNA-protein cysteine methyltransferase [Chitinophagales bacterium]|nr:methylated DNA-protein cysteine methyltransferase [Chitinophagales bacterium]
METLMHAKPKSKVLKSWSEKMHPDMKPRIVTDTSAKWRRKFGEGKMLIATPMLVDRLIREIPEGNLTTVNLIREKLARDFSTDYTCPITAGIFVWIVANAAEEERRHHDYNISPYWREIKDNGQLNPKYPGGEEHHAKLLRAEGYHITKTKSGKHYLVNSFKDHLIQCD